MGVLSLTILLSLIRRGQPLPSTFLKKIQSVRQKPKRKTPVVSYDRDIVCLTKDFESKNGTIKIPRSANSLQYLCRNGLKGKIRLTSAMSEEEIMDEIRSVFRRPFNDKKFSFSILQAGGGKYKSLLVPSLSSSFVWTASAVAGSSKSPIYILSHSDVDVILFLVHFMMKYHVTLVCSICSHKWGWVILRICQKWI